MASTNERTDPQHKESRGSTWTVQKATPPYLYLYIHTSYRNETQHKIYLRNIALILYLILPCSVPLVRYNAASVEQGVPIHRYRMLQAVLETIFT
jgi:hypothetical protein